jgi:hypothetical protein
MRPASEELDCRPTSVGALSLRRRRDPTTGDDLFKAKLRETFLRSSSFKMSEIAVFRVSLGYSGAPALAEMTATFDNPLQGRPVTQPVFLAEAP